VAEGGNVETYFDEREGRVKPVPNCAKVGLRWNGQRCEYQHREESTIMSVLGRAIPMMVSAFSREWVAQRKDEAAQHRQSQQLNGLGFLQGDYYYEDDFGNWYYEDAFGSFWGDASGSYGDSFGTSYGWDVNYGLPILEPINFGWDLPSYRDITRDLDARGIDYEVAPDGTIRFFDDAPFLPTNPQGQGNDSWLPDNIWDWLTGILDQGSDPGMVPTTGDPTAPPLPGYCPQGTYHPVNDPYACVPFPPEDPAAKKAAQQQKAAAQKAAQALRAAQQKKDQLCKDPQGRPVWLNPQTNKCELKPPCAKGMKFDSTTQRCLTPQQIKELYGDDKDWLWWVLGGGAALLILTRNNGGNRR
jgi:hypothetical protein